MRNLGGAEVGETCGEISLRWIVCVGHMEKVGQSRRLKEKVRQSCRERRGSHHAGISWVVYA